MGYVVVALVVAGLTVYALLDCLRRADHEVRGLSRPGWVVVILITVPLLAVGALSYLVLGRAAGAGPAGGRPVRRVIGPDDDLDFLHALSQRLHLHRPDAQPGDGRPGDGPSPDQRPESDPRDPKPRDPKAHDPKPRDPKAHDPKGRDPKARDPKPPRAPRERPKPFRPEPSKDAPGEDPPA